MANKYIVVLKAEIPTAKGDGATYEASGKAPSMEFSIIFS